jgi:hypothetical protein
MKRLVAIAVLAAGVAAPGALGAPLTVHAGVDTPTVEFGDALATHVVVVVDPAQVRTDSVRIVDDLAPLTVLSRSRTTRTEQGGTLVVAVDQTAVCTSEACVADNGDATPHLPRVQVTAKARDGRALQAAAAWPVLHVRGRVSKGDLARVRPPFRADTAPPKPSYRIAPAVLAWLLGAAAAVLGLAAAALLASQVRVARRRRAPPVDELARAVRLVHEAETRPEPDRRRALGLLARLLDDRDRRLAESARELAWARPAPDREALSALVTDVEREAAS